MGRFRGIWQKLASAVIEGSIDELKQFSNQHNDRCTPSAPTCDFLTLLIHVHIMQSVFVWARNHFIHRLNEQLYQWLFNQHNFSKQITNTVCNCTGILKHKH